MKEKILVGWDGSDQARNALRYAIDKAKKNELDKVTAGYVEQREGSILKDLLENYNLDIDENLLKRERNEEQKILDEAKSIGKEMGMEVEVRVIKNELGVDVEIVKFANKNDFNHIFIGSHGRSGISRIALGSVAEGVVEKADCLVTVVKCEWEP